MNIKNILITGDDGYNSIGIRLLTHFLKEEYELTVCATKSQQSGIGGKMKLNENILWHETVIDGIKTIWVDSTPVDAMEFASAYYDKKFDLAISGINLGPNVTSASMLSSGTFVAATRILSLKLANNAIAVGWDVAKDQWFRNHSEEDDISPYLNYPGETMYRLLKLSINNNFWNSELLNINFPDKPTNSIVFTHSLEDKRKAYANPLINKETNTFMYSSHPPQEIITTETDFGAIKSGLISVTPCKTNMLKDEVYKLLKDEKMNL